MRQPERGQLWLGRNHRSLMKVVDVQAGVVYAKLISTNNEWIKERVGQTRRAWLLDWHAMCVYVGDLI